MSAIGDLKSIEKFSISNKWDDLEGYHLIDCEDELSRKGIQLLKEYHQTDLETHGLHLWGTSHVDRALLGNKYNDLWVNSPAIPSLFIRIA